MTIPVIKSKLIMPQPPKYFLKSARIAELCAAIQKARVVEVVAPPGYGKTSLVVAALKEHPKSSRVCWYRLDEQDTHTDVFYAHLFETLFPVEDNAVLACREEFGAFGDVSTHLPYINQMICGCLFDCYGGEKAAKNYLVLDDYHEVSHIVEIKAAMRWFIDNLPSNFTLIIISRIECGLVTEKQKLENETLKIDYKALSFEKEEVELLTSQIGNEAFDSLSLLEMTEGWVAGLLLVLRSRVKAVPSGGINPNGTDRQADVFCFFNYFADELLREIDQAFMKFLLDISILEEFSEESANQILQTDHAEAYIKMCESRGLFLQKTSAEVPVYRFHPLFRGALIKSRDAQRSKDMVTGYQLAAADYYCGTQNFGKAIEHYLAAGRADLAAEMLSRESVNLSSLEAMGRLRLLFDKIPREVLEKNPGLMYMKSFLYQNGEEEAKRLLDKAFTIFEQADQTDMELATLFSLLAFYLFRNNAEGATHVLQKACDIALKKGDPDYDNLIPVFHFIMSVWSGKSEESDRTLRLLNLEQIQPNYVWSVLMYSCIYYIVGGKFELAQENVDAAMNMAMVSQTDMLKGFSLLFQMITAFYRNASERFDSSFTALLEISERYNVLYLLAFARVFMGFKESRKNDLDKACTILQMGIDAFSRYGNQALSDIYTLYRLLFQTVHGSKSDIYKSAEKTYQSLCESLPGFCFPELGEMLFGAIAVEDGRLETAEVLLLHALKVSEEKNELLLIATINMHLANLYYKMEKVPNLEHTLRNALFIASSNHNYVFTAVLPKTLVRLADLAVRRQIYAEYAYELIEANFGRNQAELFTRAVKLNDHNSFVDDFLAACYVSEQHRHIINVSFLGQFKLQIDGVYVPKSKFVTKKNESILKYLLFNKNKNIAKEHLIDLFWPDSDKKSGFASIRTAIYCIRKLFVESGITDARDAFLVESNGCLYIKHPEYIHADTETFLSLDNRLKGSLLDDERIILLEKMTDLYSGHLMEEAGYEEWAFFEREEYKAIYFNAISALTSLYISNAQNKNAEKTLLKALSLDPYHEELNAMLIKNYILMNQPERARMFYSGYKEMLERELGVEPDEKISTLLNNIMHEG